MARDSLNSLLEKNIYDLIKGLRSHSNDEHAFIVRCMEEIKVELTSQHMDVKSNAVNKSLYIQMFGYDVSWCAFDAIQLISSPKLEHKRVGYTALGKLFVISGKPAMTELLVLTTNSIKKDLTSGNHCACAFAIQALGSIVNEELAEQLTTDVVGLVSSSKACTRKKAIILLKKLLVMNPAEIPSALPRLIDHLLHDQDTSVQTAVVTVLCELAVTNGKALTPLIPTLLPLVNISTSNWLLIKLIKLLTQLVPHEPTLGKCLIDPLTGIIQSTSAMSLLYECINTIVAVLMSLSEGDEQSSAAGLCAEKVSVLVDDKDQNLRYLGLQTLAKILNRSDPKKSGKGKGVFDLLKTITNRRTLPEIVKRLLSLIAETGSVSFRNQCLESLLHLCTENNYENVEDFEWLICVMTKLIEVDDSADPVGNKRIAFILSDVVVRVPDVRKFAINEIETVMENKEVSGCVLRSMAYALGTYGQSEGLIDILLKQCFRQKLTDGYTQLCILQNCLKLASRSSCGWNALKCGCEELIRRAIGDAGCSMECVYGARELCRLIELSDEDCRLEISKIFSDELLPVAEGAQKRVKRPASPIIEEEQKEQYQQPQPVIAEKPKTIRRKKQRPTVRTNVEDVGAGEAIGEEGRKLCVFDENLRNAVMQETERMIVGAKEEEEKKGEAAKFSKRKKGERKRRSRPSTQIADFTPDLIQMDN